MMLKNEAQRETLTFSEIAFLRLGKVPSILDFAHVRMQELTDEIIQRVEYDTMEVNTLLPNRKQGRH